MFGITKSIWSIDIFGTRMEQNNLQFRLGVDDESPVSV